MNDQIAQSAGGLLLLLLPVCVFWLVRKLRLLTRIKKLFRNG